LPTRLIYDIANKKRIVDDIIVQCERYYIGIVPPMYQYRSVFTNLFYRQIIWAISEVVDYE